MKKTNFSILLNILFAGLLATLMISCNNNPGSTEVKAAAPCNCESDWFPHSQTPAPPEGIGSPFDTSSTTNCIFHQWSWQKFLWLTKPTQNGKALFEDSLILVDNQMTAVTPVSGVALVLDDSSQAGSVATLRSNPAYSTDNKSHTVYYSIYVSDILKHTADSMKQVLLHDTTALKNNDFTFPVGSLEVKASWISIRSLPADQASNYHTSIAIIKATGKKDTVALLGIHVVGVVINHPEFIWATFEHKDMAPEYNWTNTSSSQDVPVVSSDEKLFFKKGDTATYQNLQWPASAGGPTNVFTVYPLGIPLIAGGGFMTTSQVGSLDHDNIVGLNTCVNAGLNDVWKNYFYSGSLWINTDGLTPKQQADTIAALGGSISHAEAGSIARGSLAAFNITLETYVQVFKPMHEVIDSNLVNCFSCHNSGATIKIGTEKFSGTSPLYISHIFTRYLMKSGGVSVDEIEAVKVQDFVNMLKAKKLSNK